MHLNVSVTLVELKSFDVNNNITEHIVITKNGNGINYKEE